MQTMMAAEAELTPQDSMDSPARSKGSFLENDDDALSAEEKKESPSPSAEDDTSVADDTSLPLVSSLEEDIDLENVDGAIISNAKSFDDTKEEEDDNGDNVAGVTTAKPCPRWAEVLSTPSNAAVFTPTADINSLKQNMHGWALKNAYDRTKVLSRTGKNCSQFLHDIANLNNELSNAMTKLLPALESAAAGTPLDNFSTEINSCVMSFATQTKEMATSTQNDIARPCYDYSVNLVEEGAKIYSRYSEIRSKCAQARKDALKMRQRCEVGVKDAEGAAQALRNARLAKQQQHDRKASGEIATPVISPTQSKDEVDVDNGDTESSLDEALRRYGTTHGLVKNCEAISRALADIDASEKKYVELVEAENNAVTMAQDMERQALDAAQQNEEKRVLFMIGSLERYLQTTKEALDKMALDVTVETLEVDLDSKLELPAPSVPSTIFKKSPRRLRTTSDDSGPSINETKLLNLPDVLAETRDTMKSLIVRQSARLKALKLISSFNEGIATALETFAANLQARLESDGFAGKRDGKKSGPLGQLLKKTEGENMLSAWIVVIKALKVNAQLARDASKQVRGGNSELYKVLLLADKEIKALSDGDEVRWKVLCDSAKGESKAKLKHRQLLTDLEKAKARLSTLEDDNGPDSTNEQKVNPPPSMNKAMGKMFAILPGGGEDVMNKMLTPQQRQAVVMEQLKEVETKEAKAAELVSAATKAKSQAINTYTTEANKSALKNKADERRIWELMQESLLCAADAVNRFRQCEVNNVAGQLNELKTYVEGSVLNDVTSWTQNTEKRFDDHRARFVPAAGENVPDSFDTGYTLKVHRIDCTEVKKYIEKVLSDENVEECITNSESAEVESTPTATKVAAEDEDKQKLKQLPDVPKDPIIDKMEPIFSKTLKGVSIETYYEKGWSDKINPLYRPWLERKGSFDVSVSDWETSDEGFVNSWSGEKYYQKRVVKFKFKRTTHLYIGPPIAGVTQTQYCYKDGDDKCVLQMTVEMDGIPYSDVFAVEVRWSARRVGTDDISIDAGVFVRFIKSSMFASKIKSGTLTETKPIHLDLFEELKAVIKSDETVSELAEEPKEENEQSPEAIEEESAQVVQVQTQSSWNLSSMFLDLPKPVQIFALGVSSFVVMRLLFTRSDPSIAQLSRQVEDLESDVREIKAMLKTILEAVEDNRNSKSA